METKLRRNIKKKNKINQLIDDLVLHIKILLFCNIRHFCKARSIIFPAQNDWTVYIASNSPKSHNRFNRPLKA